MVYWQGRHNIKNDRHTNGAGGLFFLIFDLEVIRAYPCEAEGVFIRLCECGMEKVAQDVLDLFRPCAFLSVAPHIECKNSACVPGGVFLHIHEVVDAGVLFFSPFFIVAVGGCW